MKLTRAQLTRLQTVYSQCVTHCTGFAADRASRMAWANRVLGLSGDAVVQSFSDLSGHRARILIDAAQGELGHRAPLKPASKRDQAHKVTAEDARRAGLDGRKDDIEFVTTPRLVNAEDLETISSYYHRLGWTQKQFEAWLGSGRSPLRRRQTIRTEADANKVRWALKNMLQDAGLWADWKVA